MNIAIASGKGGTGKTTLSVNLASFIAEKKKTLLVDLDVEEPNSGIFLDLDEISTENKNKMIPEWESEKCILCGKCQEVCNFNAIMKLADEIMVFPELCHSCYACSELCPTNSIPMKPKKMGETSIFEKGNLTFIESKLIVGEEQAVPLIGQTIKQVKKDFKNQDYIFFDSPPGTSCPVIETVKDTDYIILITEPTPFGFHDLKLAIETVKILKIDFGVVINRHGIGNDDVEVYCKEEKIKILAKIPNDKKIAELYSQGKLLYKEFDFVNDELTKIYNFLEEINDGASK